MANYTHVIWDFNGTILDDTDASIMSENVLLKRRHMPLIENRAHYQRLFCFPVIDYYRRLGYDFALESFDTLSVEWVEQYKRHARTATLHEGVLALLQHNKKAGVHQIILSATELSMLHSQVETLGIGGYFHELLALDNIHAHSKIDIGKQWLHKTAPERALLIGDTVHDFEVAEALGVDCVLVAAGHQSRDYLSGLGVPVFDSLTDVLASGLI